VNKKNSSLRVSSSFQIFALTAGEMSIDGERNCPGGLYGGISPGENVLHSRKTVQLARRSARNIQLDTV